jgi:uroporphyrinogen-III decarboxylase
MAAGLDALRSRLSRDLFLPVAFRLALKLEQATWDEIAGDPGLASFSLRSVQRLFKSDGLVSWFDDWLEAEGAGAKVQRDDDGGVSGKPVLPTSLPDAKTFRAANPVKAVTDLTKRLCTETGNDAVVLGCLTGGATLLARLYGEARRDAILKELAAGKVPDATRKAVDAAAQLSVALANAYCEAGAGALVMAEHDRVADASYLRGFDAIFNVARYLNVPILMLCRHAPDAAFVEAAKKAGVTHVVSRSAKDDKVVAVPCGSASEIEKFVGGWSKGAGGRRLVMTEWELPADAAPEQLIALQKKISG